MPAQFLSAGVGADLSRHFITPPTFCGSRIKIIARRRWAKQRGNANVRVPSFSRWVLSALFCSSSEGEHSIRRAFVDKSVIPQSRLLAVPSFSLVSRAGCAVERAAIRLPRLRTRIVRWRCQLDPLLGRRRGEGRRRTRMCVTWKPGASD